MANITLAIVEDSGMLRRACPSAWWPGMRHREDERGCASEAIARRGRDNIAG